MGKKTVYGQPAPVLHEEAEVFQRLPQVAAAVLQVNSGVCHNIQQPLSLRQPQRTDKARLSKITKTATRLIGRPVGDSSVVRAPDL